MDQQVSHAEVTTVGSKIVHAEVVGKDGPLLQKF